MKSQIHIIIFSFVITGILCQKPVYKCALSGTKCTFSNVILNSTHYEWQPTSDDPNLVRIVKFSGSKMLIVTSGLCEVFPFLKELNLEYLGIQEIQEDAFHACKELTLLYLNDNEIKNFHPDTFLYTKNLEIIRGYSNKIEKLEHNSLFSNMQNLSFLDLGTNNLTKFSPEIIRYNKKLTNIYLHSNDLSDIEAEIIVDFLPNLKRFLLDDNEMSCTRVVQINQLLISKNIQNDYRMNVKVRYYPQQAVFGSIKCNPDISWMASNYRKDKLKTDERFDKLEIQMKKIIALISASNT